MTNVSRSSQQPVLPQHAVLLLDTLGELTRSMPPAMWCLWGSLVPVGGHNLLEPAALSVPAISGPHTFNAPDIAGKLAERDALRHVYSGTELAEVVLELLDNPQERARQAAQAHAVVQESRGALARLLVLIERGGLGR
jgi:3-deoxy-D-manno-octulosonic-acid transferase